MVGGLFILWNFGLMVQYVFGVIDRDGTTPFLQVAINQFTVVPTKLIENIARILIGRFQSMEVNR